MNASRADYWQRRALLQQQSAQLRHNLERQVQALAPAWQVLDGTQRGVAWVRQRPWVLALGLLLLARKPRTALRWGWLVARLALGAALVGRLCRLKMTRLERVCSSGSNICTRRQDA